jgi:CHASE3 domain sensor protein
MPWSLTRGQTVAIVLLVAALLTDAVLTRHNIREVATSVQWVSHTHEVLGQLEQVVSTLKDAETGQRGYLLTGKRPYLDPYEQAVAPSGWRCSGGGSTASRPSPTRAGPSCSPGSTCSRARASA